MIEVMLSSLMVLAFLAIAAELLCRIWEGREMPFQPWEWWPPEGLTKLIDSLRGREVEEEKEPQPEPPPPPRISRQVRRRAMFEELMRTKYRACGITRRTWLGKLNPFFFQGDSRPRRVRRAAARMEAKARWRSSISE